MDYVGDVKILVLLLGFLAACSGKEMRVLNSGYTYNRGQDTNSLNKILKAVLVHESTGHGLYSGSVSSADADLKVTTQRGERPSFGYAYPTNQQMNGNVRAADITTIRVFHESTGNTGNILRNYSPPYSQKSNADVPRGFSYSASAMPNPAQTLRFIHEKALHRSSSAQQNIGRVEGNAAHQYENSHQPGNSDNFLETHQQAKTSGPGIISNTKSSSGYQYPSPIQTINSGNENVGNSRSNTRKAAILSISQAQNVNFGNVETQSDRTNSNNYKYPSPIQALNRVSTNLENARNGLNLNAVSGSSKAQNVIQVNTGDESAQTASGGYQYLKQGILESSGSASNNYQHQTPIQAQNINLGINEAGSRQKFLNEYQNPRQGIHLNGGSASNGYQYLGPNRALNTDSDNLRNTGSNSLQITTSSLNQAQNGLRSTAGRLIQDASNGYQNPNPSEAPNRDLGSEILKNSFSNLNQAQAQSVNVQSRASGSTQATFNGYQYQSVNQVPNRDLTNENLINSFSSSNRVQNVNLQNTVGGPAQTASNGYQYPSPNQSLNRDLTNEDPRNSFFGSNQAENVNLQGPASGSAKADSNGYQYPNRGPDLNGEYSRSLQGENTGYRYQTPKSMDYPKEKQNGAEQIAISHYSSFSQLSPANEGYRYENSGMLQNTGPLHAYHYVDQSSKGGYRNEKSTTDGYKYQNPNGESSQPKQNQFSGPGQSTSAGYRYDGPVQALEFSYSSTQSKSEGNRFDKPEKPADAKSNFMGQPYLPLPPAAKESDYKYGPIKSTLSDGYRYDKPEQSGRPETNFKGQPYLPLPELSSRPQTTFKGQPYLPLPPVSGGW